MNRIWIELYPKNIRENGKKIKKASGKDLYAVVKNNGYGLGCQRVAQALRGIAKGFCVGNVEEGISLREMGISDEIIILGYSPFEDEGKIREYNLTQSIFSPDYARVMGEKCGGKMRTAFALNSGMNRLGFDSLSSLLPYLSHPKFSFESLFTHFASGDLKKGRKLTLDQYRRFQEIVEILKRDFSFKTHCQNTATALNYPQFKGDFIRAGIGLFGVETSFVPLGLEEVFSLCATAVLGRVVNRGEYLSYGVYRAKAKPTVIISCGYGDGFPPLLQDKCKVKIGDYIYKVRGKVCMNMLCAQGKTLPPPFEKAVLFGKNGYYSLQEVARLSHLSPYQILCGLSSVEKVIVKAGQRCVLSHTSI